ncbi:MAG: zinc ribbon domain-containing protein [Candidatus Pelethousia sp.]|nr:zinc ribbon domain-containing protein [Candidatus Pelethousia sp.]
MFCHMCGRSINEQAKFCPFCGVSTAEDDNQTAPCTPPEAQDPFHNTPGMAGTYGAPPASYSAPRRKGMHPAALAGIIGGSALLLAALLFFGLRLFDGKGERAFLGTWSGTLQFRGEAWESANSALVYASGGGDLSCTLNVQGTGANGAELIVKEVPIPLDVEQEDHSLLFTGTLNGETLHMKGTIEKNGQITMKGEGNVIAGEKTVPFTLSFTQTAKKPPKLSGGGNANTLPLPPVVSTPGKETQQVNETVAPEEAASETVDLAAYLPGLWVSPPDVDFCASIYAFDGNGLLGGALAFSEGEETLDNWGTDRWTQDPYFWQEWKADGNTVTLLEGDQKTTLHIAVQDEETIRITYGEGDEQYPFYRMGEEPTLADYLIGTWVPDAAEEDGVYAALTFMPGGDAVLTGAEKEDSTASLENWGSSQWNILGKRNGSWHSEGNKVIVKMQSGDDEYTVTVDGPNHCVFAYGASWERAFSRVIEIYSSN